MPIAVFPAQRTRQILAVSGLALEVTKHRSNRLLLVDCTPVNEPQLSTGCQRICTRFETTTHPQRLAHHSLIHSPTVYWSHLLSQSLQMVQEFPAGGRGGVTYRLFTKPCAWLGIIFAWKKGHFLFSFSQRCCVDAKLCALKGHLFPSHLFGRGTFSNFRKGTVKTRGNPERSPTVCQAPATKPWERQGWPLHSRILCSVGE